MAARNPQPAEPATQPFRAVAFMLSSLGYAISRRFHNALAPLELDPGEFSLLRAVSANEGQPQNALAERLHISPSWMVAIVDQLEHRELLERRPHTRDRRVRTLHLTAAGKKLIRQAELQAQQFDRQVGHPLSEAELGQLLGFLERIAAGLELEPGAHSALREPG